MRRYKFLQKENVFEALNRLRDAFLAAKDGNEVEEIINGLLTFDEKMKIGRRVQIAELLRHGMSIDEIAHRLNVGKTTISSVSKSIDTFPNCFKLLSERKKTVEKKYQNRKFNTEGSSQKIFKKKVYTGIKRSDVER